MLSPETEFKDISSQSTTCTEIPTVSASTNPGVLADIYENSHNIAVWERILPSQIQLEVQNLLASGKSLQISDALTPHNAFAVIKESLEHAGNAEALSEDIAKLVDMFCCLFDLKQVGLRLTALDQAMCPRFHVDRVPCRLITTYHGTCTQWLAHQSADHTKLGKGSNGLSDEESGIYSQFEDIQHLTEGDVALLKGTLWEGNEHSGLVHRSPTPAAGETRLLLTLDFLS